MCIIAAKPIGVKMPNEETIRTMWNNNNDGAGFMWAENGRVHIRKGYMEYESFKNALDEVCEKLDVENTSIVMHFRITTHGGTKPENCHPFPISGTLGILQKKWSTTDLGMAHNGILPITPGPGISDTMEYVLKYISVFKKINRRFYDDPNFVELIKNTSDGNRLCFLTGNGRIITFGNFVEENGILYSNTSYKAPLYSNSLYMGFITKLLCSAEDADVCVVNFNGDIVEPTWDYYIDKNNTVYKYNYNTDIFYECSCLRTNKNGFNEEYAFSANVEFWYDPSEEYYDDIWTEKLETIRGYVQDDEKKCYSNEDEEYLTNKAGDVFRISPCGKYALKLMGYNAMSYDGSIYTFHRKNSVGYECMYEEDYYEYIYAE